MKTKPTLEQYFTHASYTKALLQRQKISGNVFEPCAGNSSISSVLIPIVELIIQNDIDEKFENMDFNFDASKLEAWYCSLENNWNFDWIITNPPFSKAFEILKNSLLFAKQGVALLLRLTFLEPTVARGAWLAMNPPTKIIILPRYSFSGDGKVDSVTCAWMVWEKGSNVKNQTIEIVSKDFL